MRTERSITFTMEDLRPAFDAVGIDPDSLTDHEWGKFEDAFMAGTHWDEVARSAAEVITELLK